MKSLNQVILILLSAFLACGFRLWVLQRWDVSKASPTLWLRVCDDSKPTTYSDNTMPDGDALGGQSPTFKQAIQSIIDDFNNLPSTYLRLEMYPDDVNNPAIGSEFTIAKADRRTVDICSLQVEWPKGGHTQPTLDGDKITACHISLKKIDNLREFVLTAGHELGHCIGLNHPQETVHAVMSYFGDRDKFVRYQIDDKMGFTYLYPSNPDKTREQFGFGMRCTRQ